MAIDNEHAGAVLLKIFEKGVVSDQITLVAGADGRSVPIHRVVLLANSEYFTASLGSNFVEANENKFTLDETDGQTLKAVVDFCYTGRIDLTEENVSKYLAIASGVELYLLEAKCCRFLEDKLNVNNALATLGIADKYSSHELRQKALNSVCELFDKLPSTHIDGLEYRLMEEILKRDIVSGEEQFIFERLVNWFRIDEDKRGQHMPELLKLIRLPLIPTQYLNGDTMQTIYREFDSFEYIFAEYKRRVACPTSTACFRRHGPIFCLFLQNGSESDEDRSAVKIERYSSALDVFEEVGEIELGQREDFAAILHENKVFVLGGQVDEVAQKSVSVFDLSSGEEKVLPEMASARLRFSSILRGKYIYVFGGSSNYPVKLSSCERFDMETETWETMKPMHTARGFSSVAVMNEFLCVAGGYEDGGTRESKSVELFDPQNNEWTTLPAMVVGRSIFALISANRYLYAMKNVSSIERYDTLKNCWTRIESPGEDIAVSSSVVVNGKIHIIGDDGDFGEMKIGENGCCSFIPSAKSRWKSEVQGQFQLFTN